STASGRRASAWISRLRSATSSAASVVSTDAYPVQPRCRSSAAKNAAERSPAVAPAASASSTASAAVRRLLSSARPLARSRITDSAERHSTVGLDAGMPASDPGGGADDQPRHAGDRQQDDRVGALEADEGERHRGGD